MIHFRDPRQRITFCGITRAPVGDTIVMFEAYKVDCPKCIAKGSGKWYCNKCCVAVDNRERCKICGKTEKDLT